MSAGSVQRKVGTTGRVSWRAVVDVPSANGKRRQKTKTFRKKADAEAWMVAMLGNASRGIGAQSDERLADYLTQRWLPYHRDHVKPSTWRIHESNCRRRIIPALGAIRLSSLTPSLVQDFYKSIDQYAVNTVRSAGMTLNTALNQAVRWELLYRNPAKGARLPPPPKRAPTVWSAEQVRTFLDQEKDPAWHCLFTVILATGVRLSEALGLTWPDVDFEHGTIQIARGVNRGVVSAPKTAASARIIAIPESVLTLLRQQHARSSHRRVHVGGETYVPVFPGRMGGFLSADQVQWRFGRSCVKAKLPVIRVHDLRHTNATLALEAGVPLKVISERLGHSNIGITSDVYAHVTKNLDQGAANRIGGALFGEEQESKKRPIRYRRRTTPRTVSPAIKRTSSRSSNSSARASSDDA